MDDKGAVAYGICRRYPPTAAIGNANRVLAPGHAEQSGTAALWPPVRPTDYCLEFKPAPIPKGSANDN